MAQDGVMPKQTTDFNRDSHPERESDELFITNATIDEYNEIGWQTKRFGQIAYNPKGIPTGGLCRSHVEELLTESRPVFIKRSEVEELASQYPSYRGFLNKLSPQDHQS